MAGVGVWVRLVGCWFRRMASNSGVLVLLGCWSWWLVGIGGGLVFGGRLVLECAWSGGWFIMLVW